MKEEVEKKVEGVLYSELNPGDFFHPVSYPNQTWLKVQKASVLIDGIRSYYGKDELFTLGFRYIVYKNAAIIKDINV